ncbi:MAG: hypothetical protein H6607_00385 [Flavobacteriales bacterium]|nr:hypothetical protein [Flavobacteriales bacterium]
MKGLRYFVTRISQLIFIIFFIFFSFCTISAFKVHNQILSSKRINLNGVSDTAVVHFVHGSIRKENCSYTKKRLGGFLGGHVEIEVDGFVYGFVQNSLPIHSLPQKKFNSRMEKHNRQDWQVKVSNDKVTSVYLPIQRFQKNKLKQILNSYCNKTPYDYAFWGQRCSSSSAKILSDAGIFPQFSTGNAIIAFFYPRLFRHVMINLGRKHNLRIKVKKGVECYYWE